MGLYQRKEGAAAGTNEAVTAPASGYTGRCAQYGGSSSLIFAASSAHPPARLLPLEHRDWSRRQHTLYTHKVSEKALNRSSLIHLVSLARIYCKATVKGPCGAISCPPMNTIDIHKHMHASARIQSRRHLLAAGLACATAASAWAGSCFRFLMRSTRLQCRRNTPRVPTVSAAASAWKGSCCLQRLLEAAACTYCRSRQLHPPAQCLQHA